MEEHEKHGEEGHDGMGHGPLMMLLGCGVPLLAFLVLPRLGVSLAVAAIIGVAAMVGMHGGMMLLGRVRSGRRNERHSDHDRRELSEAPGSGRTVA